MKNGANHIASPTVIEDIDGIMDQIRSKPEFSACRRKEVIKYLRNEANKHSVDIEYGDGVKDRDLYVALEKGWDYICNRGIGLGTLGKLGHIVQPYYDKPYVGVVPSPEGFRCKDTQQAQFGKHWGSAPMFVYGEMDGLVRRLNSSSGVHPIQRAADAHLSLVDIHPYVDGNGRVARLLSNYCLKQKDYPPAMIEEADKKAYFGLISGTIAERKESGVIRAVGNIGPWETEFVNFIGERVLKSAKILEEQLAQNRSYSIRMKVKDKGLVYALDHSLKGAAKSNGNGIKIKRKRRGRETTLEVSGNISFEQMERVATHCLAGKVYYELEVNDDCC
jgi:hypothetical protein